MIEKIREIQYPTTPIDTQNSPKFDITSRLSLTIPISELSSHDSPILDLTSRFSQPLVSSLYKHTLDTYTTSLRGHLAQMGESKSLADYSQVQIGVPSTL